MIANILKGRIFSLGSSRLTASFMFNFSDEKSGEEGKTTEITK